MESNDEYTMSVSFKMAGNDNSGFDKTGEDDPEIAVSGFNKDEFLQKAKEGAMTKLASFTGRQQEPYPTPFLNLSDFSLPKTMKEIFRWCRYFYKFDPLIAGAINSLSSFPITEVVLEDKDDGVDAGEDSDKLKFYKKIIIEKLEITKTLFEIGIDYWNYGNCFVFGEFEEVEGSGVEWKHIMRLDPAKIEIDVDPLTQKKTFKWEIPAVLRKIVKEKKPKTQYDKMPDMIKQAAIKGKAVVLNSDHVYHFARPGESGDGSVWGTPVILNVMKLLMYRNVLRQAQEALGYEHIYPWRIYYLQETNSHDPNQDFNQVANNLATQLTRMTRDPNYKVVSPIPVGVVNLGGQGRALMLTPEMEQIQAEILAGMSVPREFIFGGVSYSGTSFSLRILENMFITYRLLLIDCIQNFLIKKLAIKRGEFKPQTDEENSLIQAKFSDLKMQDDVQQKQLLVNLNAANKVPDEELYSVMGLDAEAMRKKIEQESLEKIKQETKIKIAQMDAELELQKKQIDMQLILEKYRRQKARELNLPHEDGIDQIEQAKVNAVVQATTQKINEQAGLAHTPEEQAAMTQQQQQPGQPGQTGQPGQQSGMTVDPARAQQLAMQVAQKMVGANEQKKAEILANVPVALKSTIMSFYHQLMTEKEQDEQGKEDGIDMRPYPEKLPPRRKTIS